MIINLFINLVVLILGAIFSWLPVVSKLPTINFNGTPFDIDAAFVTGIGSFNTFVSAFWPLQYLFFGFLVLMSYYSIKILVRFFLGHRAPGSHH